MRKGVMSTSSKGIAVVGGALLFAAGFAGGRLGGHASGTATDAQAAAFAELREARHSCAGGATASCYGELGAQADHDKLIACLADRIGACEDQFLKVRAHVAAGGLPGANTASR